jgi:hypothetical protein
LNPSVELRIGSLVLHGCPASQARLVGAALERELGRLIVVRGMPKMLSLGLTAETVDAGQVGPVALCLPGPTATAIAEALYRGLDSGQ